MPSDEKKTAPPAEAVVVHEAVSGLDRYDPFQLMDHLDEDAIIRELEGIATEALVYEVSGRDGKKVTGLSKGGVDECVNLLAHQGEVIREHSEQWEVRGEGEDQVAYFTVKATRYIVAKDGREVQLDTAIGAKAQDLYREAREELTLDTVVKMKKYRSQVIKDAATGQERRYTWRDVLGEDRDYVEWVAENAHDETLRDFAVLILAGEDPRILPGRHPNPFWFESGMMKAARNVRFRMIPADVKARVIARAKQEGKVRTVAANGEPAGNGKPMTDKQTGFIEKLMKSHLVSDAERKQMAEYLATPRTLAEVSKVIDYWQRTVEERRAKEKSKDAAGGPEPSATTSKSKQRSARRETKTSDGSDETSPGSEDDKVREEEARTVVYEIIDGLLKDAPERIVKVWKPYYEGLKKENAPVGEFKKVRRDLEKALDDAGSPAA